MSGTKTFYVVFNFQHKNGWGYGWCTLNARSFETRADIEESIEAIIELNPDLYENVVIMSWRELAP